MSTGMNLGGAAFTLHTNMEAFKAGIASAKKAAQSGSSEIKRWFDSIEQSSRSAARGLQEIRAPLNAVQTSSRNAAMGMLYLGQTIDDAQYGFRSIVNNIPQLVFALGGDAGIAGAAAIAAVGLNQLLTHFNEMSDAMSAAWSAGAVGQLEQIRLKAEAARAALDKVPPFTKGEGRQAAAVEEFVQNAPKEKLIQDVMGAIQRNPGMQEEMSFGEKRQLSRAQHMAAFTKKDEEIRARRVEAIQAQIAKDMLARTQERAEKIVGEAMLPGEQGKLGRANLMALLPQLSQQFREMSPEGIKEAEAQKKRDEKAKAEFATDQAAKEEEMKMAGVERDEKLRKEASQEQRLAAERQTDLAATKERDKMASALRDDEAKNSQQAAWEAEGRRNIVQFDRERERKEAGTARDIARSPLALAMLQGRNITSRDIEGVMRASGIDTRAGGQRPGQVLRELRSGLTEDIAKTMRETGATAPEARKMLEIEMQNRLRVSPRDRQQSEMVGISEFWKKIQTGAFNNKSDRIAEQQLQQLNQIRQAIINRSGARVAVASGPA